MTARPYAEVIVNVRTRTPDQVFHYRVPPALAGRLAEGMRVVVPFGGRTVEGYVLGFCDTPEVPETKEIIDLAEDEPLFNRDLLALAGWLAERYMCSVAEAVRSMMPAGARMVGRRYIVPVEDAGLPGAEALNSLNSREADLYNYIVKKRKILYDEIHNLVGRHRTGPALKKLTTLGLVEVQGQMKSKVRPHLVRLVEPAARGEDLNRLISLLAVKAPKQAAVLETLRARGALSSSELAGLAGTTPATVRELVKKGHLTVQETPLRRDPYAARSFAATAPLSLAAGQAAALNEITAAMDRCEHRIFLLHGVTGSGKTEVYLQAIARCLDGGRPAIVLVPEISLTPQMVERFKGRFGNLVAVLHSRLSEGERYDEWRQVKAGLVKIVVGARSAVFAPFSDPGLIVIDEEHENSYKQEDNPKYHAREVAVARARLSRGVVVLGSATPSLESYARAVEGRYRLLHLAGRVTGQPLPKVRLVDLREEIEAGHRGIFSRLLVEKIGETLERKEQVILFLNRRGYSTFVVCRECGLVLKCPGCSITLTLHAGDNVLRCHYCNYRCRVPDRCPQCGGGKIRHFGTGTQKVEEEVARWFPAAGVARLDVDTTSGKGSHERILDRFKAGRVDILVGTQMIAKGLDFPGVTLVGVITADTALNLPDFRAAERTFQLLTQVAGRAGRGEAPGEVIIQTYNPEHYSIVHALAHDYHGFYQAEMKIRAALEYPPYCGLVRIVISGTEENRVIRGAELLAETLRRAVSSQSLGVSQPLLGPAPAPVSRLRGKFRWQVCLRGKPGPLVRRLVRSAVQQFEAGGLFNRLGVSIDADPLGMM